MSKDKGVQLQLRITSMQNEIQNMNEECDKIEEQYQATD